MSDNNNLDKFLKEKKPRSSKKVGGTTSKRTTKKGGGLVEDIQKLAVPFAILLAKQGVQAMFEKENVQQTNGNVAVASPANAVKNAKNANAKKSPAKGGYKKKQAGGSGCTACEMLPPMNGGSKRGGTNDIKKKYNELASRIENFLSNY